MTDALRLIGPRAVMRALSCGKDAAYERMRSLGGWKEPGVGWRMFERRLVEYLRERERGHEPWKRNSRSSSAGTTGIATSERRTVDEASEPCTSETTAAQRHTEPPSPPTGKSKHALRLAKVIAQLERESRSSKRSTRSAPSKNSPA